MYLFKRIKATLKGWKNQPSKQKVENLANCYETRTEGTADILDCEGGKEDLRNLIWISRYADMGELKAVRFAFCLGYKAGKGGEKA